MPLFEIICLANSRKLGGRCVAGLRLDGAGWLRAVGVLPDGILYPPDYTLNDRTEAALLDVIQVGTRVPRAAAHQPENWVIDGSSWKLRSRPLLPVHVPILRNALVNGPELLRGFSDRVPYSSFQQQHAAVSLALVAPESIDLYHFPTPRGTPQVRGRFFLGTGSQAFIYDLAVTDPRWEANVIHQGPRILRQGDGKFVLTISLSEPFGRYCYKLIAAIVVLPPAIAAAL